MPNFSRSLLATLLLLVAAVPAQAITLNDHLDLSLTAEVVSDYRSRGQSQTLGDPAIQASASLSHSSGLYAGVWTSNVDFGFDIKTRQEIDYYAGYFWQVNDNISLDVGYAKYAYENSGNLNVSERASHLAGGHPVVRQQLGQGAGLLRRQAHEHVLQVGVRIVSVQAG